MIDVKSLLVRGCRESSVVGIGLMGETAAATEAILLSSGCRLNVRYFESAKQLVSSLSRGEVAAAVRGTLSSSEVLKELKSAFSIREVMRTAVLEDVRGKQFLLTPVGIDEGRTMSSRLKLATTTIAYFEPAGWQIKIGVLSKGRVEDKGRGAEICRSLEAGEKTASTLLARGYAAEHFGILVEDAVKMSDLVIATDGIAGNLMFRSMHFVGGGKAYGAPVVNLEKVFVDTSRAKADFSDSIMLAAGLAAVKTL